MKDIKLFVSVYRAETKACPPLYPVSAGAALYQVSDPLLPLRDDTGDNISNSNPQFCELTVQYWGYRNQSFDIGGLLHQRRYFDVSDEHPFAFDQPHPPKRPYRIADSPENTPFSDPQYLTERISALFERYRFVAPLSENLYQSVQAYYNKHDRQGFDDLSLTLNIIKTLYPDYLDSAKAYFNGHNAYFCNMFMADYPLFCEYSHWLFSVLSEYTKQKPAHLQYPREQGKIAERLFGVYFTHLKQHTDIPWAELPRIHFASVGGATPENTSFQKLWYRLCPPGSLRRGIVRKFGH